MNKLSLPLSISLTSPSIFFKQFNKNVQGFESTLLTKFKMSATCVFCKDSETSKNFLFHRANIKQDKFINLYFFSALSSNMSSILRFKRPQHSMDNRKCLHFAKKTSLKLQVQRCQLSCF